MTARWLVADVFDGLATIPDGTVDLVVSSPPFLALRSYLPAGHPDKEKEIGSEATPAEYIDTLLRVTAELRRVLAPHGSLCVELGDTYSGSGGAGGDYNVDGMREGQLKFSGSAAKRAANGLGDGYRPSRAGRDTGWPMSKSKTLIPELYRVALAYGLNPLTGEESQAGTWRVRNVVTWCRVNPPVGALSDKWRPATSDVVVACTSEKRYWDDIATRQPHKRPDEAWAGQVPHDHATGRDGGTGIQNTAGAPLLDWWEISPGGYSGSHYAVWPPALVEPLVKAMAPPRVCVTCGEPSRRIVETANAVGTAVGRRSWMDGTDGIGAGHSGDIGVQANDRSVPDVSEKVTVGWTDCGHDRWRPAHILDPFAGSGTTLAVATGHGHDATGIDLDPRNADLARERVGPMLFEEVQL